MNDLSEDHSLTRAALDPAADAAAMLLRLGFALFALVVPSAGLASRWVIVVLVPIGAVLIILSGLLRGDPLRALRAGLTRLVSPSGLAACLIGAWALLSLLWTPVPGAAGGKLFKLAGVILLALWAIESLPQKMRASNLHLVTIGVAVAAVMLLSALIGDLTGLWYLKLAALSPGRTALLLLCLGWCAGAWLLIKDRRPFALALGGMITLVAMLDPSREVLVSAGIGLLVFAMGWAAPERTGRFVGLAGAALVLFAPLLTALAGALSAPRLSGWWDVLRADPLRGITGRGFDAATAYREQGALSDTLPFSLFSDLWFDLGVLGALGVALLVARAFLAAGRLGLELAPLAMAALATASTYALLERGATQTWWLNAMAVFAIVLASVERGRYRTVRPRAAISAPFESTSGTAT